MVSSFLTKWVTCLQCMYSAHNTVFLLGNGDLSPTGCMYTFQQLLYVYLFNFWERYSDSHCHVSLFKLNIKLAKTWTLLSNNVNTTIRKYSLRAFIWVVSPQGFIGTVQDLEVYIQQLGSFRVRTLWFIDVWRSFLGLVKFTFGSERVEPTLVFLEME